MPVEGRPRDEIGAELRRLRAAAQEDVRQYEARQQAGDDELFNEVFEEELDSGDVVEAEDVEAELPGEQPAAAEGQGGEQEEEGQRPRQRPAPEAPSRAEVEEHELTHIPYRAWCRHCRAARGREDCHRRKTEAEKMEDENDAWSQ